MKRRVGADISDRARKPTTVNITPSEKKKLERLAKRLGFLTPRGPGAGEIGNVSALLRDIAAGKVTVERSVRAEPEGAEDESE